MTAKIYNFTAEKRHRDQDMTALLGTFDTLPCPHCERLTKPSKVMADYTVFYACDGGHKWRIAPDGEAMRGHVGKRYF